MKLLIYTPTFDSRDPVFGFAVNWVKEFSQQMDKVVVFSRYAAHQDLPSETPSVALGKAWIPRVLKIWYYAFKFRKDYDCVFVHMSPEVVLAGWPIWSFLRKPIYVWYAHGAIPWSLHLAEPLVKLIFSSSENGMRLPTKKARFVGQGIDTELFKPDKAVPKEQLIVTVSRITPRKNYEQALEFLANFKSGYPDMEWKYHIIGPSLGYEEYKESLLDKARVLGLAERFAILPEMRYVDLPIVYRRAACFLSTSQTGSMDKVVLESLACGTPVIASGQEYQDLKGVTDMRNQGQAFVVLQSQLSRPLTDEDARVGLIAGHSLRRLVSVLAEEMKLS